MLLKQGSDYTVNSGGQYTFAAGLIGQQVTIQYQVTGAGVGAHAAMGLGLATGAPGQAVWGFLQSNYPAQALAYNGFTYVYAPAYDLGSDATVSNHSFEVSTPWEVVASGDANPAAIAQDLLTNARYGANFPASRAGSYAAWSNYALAQNLLMSPALVQQKPAAEWLQYLLSLSNTDVTWSQGMLKFVPLGDASCAANGASFSPTITPVYDLTDDHFLVGSGDDDPLKIERRANDDTYNHVRLEYSNRNNQYNLEVAEAKDAADIERRGLRTKEVVEAHAICDPAVAQMLVSLLLQRELGVRNLYRFQLPWTFGLLEPLDLVTVSDVYLALTRIPVRINKVSELEGGDFDVEAEDCPIGMASAPAYGVQAGSGFAHNYNASPGDVSLPFFFEPPVQLTTTGLEVWIALSGLTSLWGGCRIWASNDGVSYRQVGTVRGGTRYGALSAALGTLGTDTLGVALTGQGGTLLSGSAADAANSETLVFVGDAQGGEYLAYQTAALTGANAYNLTTLTRGAFYTTPKARAANQATVVRVDSAVAKSDPLQPSQVGKPVYFKFTSFNVYGGGEQALFDVPAYSYTPTGYMLKLPPPAVSSFVFDGADTFTWTAVTYPSTLLAGYRIKYQYGNNRSWVDAIPLHTDIITDSPYKASVVPQGPLTFMLRAVDVYGNESPTSAYVVTQLGDATTANVIQASDYKAQGWPGTITGVASVSGGNIVATNQAAAFGSASQGALSAVPSDPALQVSYAGISYAPPTFYPASAGRMTLLHTVSASQYQVNYRPSNPAAVWAQGGSSAAFIQSGSAAMFAGKPAWLPWPGEVQATVQPYEFQVVCGAGLLQQQITRLTAQVDVPDINLRLGSVPISAAGSRLAGAVGKFRVITNVNLTLQSGGAAIDAQYTDKDATQGPNIICINSAGTQVAATVDALLQGY